MKAFVKVLALVLVLSFLASCGAKTTTGEGTEPPVVEDTLTEAEQWAKDNELGPYQPATLDWAAIEAAAKEEGSVCIYANSSKIEKLMEPWNALYPDIVFDCGDTDDVATKMQAEQEAGNVVGDIWFNSDGHLLYGLFVPNQWLWSFVPDGYENPNVTPEQPFAIARNSIDAVGYNGEIHPEGCPLTSWWQLTEPALEGKFYMEDPISDVSTMAKIATFVQYADDMATAYKNHYGVEWNTDALYGDDTLNAGWLFIKKLAQNKPGIMPGGDEVDTAYASLGMDPTIEPGYGWTGWDSIEATWDGEIAMMPCLTMEPTMGIQKTSYVGIATFAEHPNAAKLFIKFLLTTQEGADPWFKVGVYPGNRLLDIPEDMPSYDEVNVFYMDPIFDWNNVSAVRDFWAVNLLGQ